MRKHSMFGMSADAVFAIANWFLLLSLVVGVVSTYAIVASGKIRDDESKLDLAHARQDAAKANERAAQLESDAAFARLETERLKGLMAWRRISALQHAKLIAVLKGNVADDIWVEYVSTDPESSQFHADIYQTLKDAGLNTHYFSGWERAVGLQLTNANSPAGVVLKNAFLDVGIVFDERQEPGLVSAADKVEIIVGSRPPEFFTSETGPVKAR